MVGKKQSIALFGIYLLAGLLAAEIGARGLLYIEWRRELKAGRGLNMPDSVVGYRLIPGRAAWGRTVNSLGFMGPEFPMRKPGGVFRIVCSGNSITFGEAASSEKTTYPALLEKAINERGGIMAPVEVINAGVMGYTSYQCLMDMKTRLIALQPDLVILCAMWNDMTMSKYIGWKPDINWHDPWHFFTVKGSYAFWLLNQRAFHIPAEVKPDPLKAFTGTLEEIVALCESHGIGLAFLDSPTMFSNVMTPGEEKKCTINFFVRGEIPLYAAYVAAMKEVAARHLIPVLDSGLTYSVSGKDSLLVDVCHPNDTGYRHMVRVLYPQVKTEIQRIMKTRPVGEHVR